MEITRSVIEEIFLHPPVNAAELRQRMMPVNAESARRVLVGMLQRSLVGEEEYGLFLEVFGELGIGGEREELLAVVNDKNKDTLARTLAMTLLAEDDPDSLDADVAGMDPDDFSRLADRPLIELMTAVEADADAAADVTVFLLESPAEIRDFLLLRLGSCRREVGVSAVTAYGHALRCPGLADLHPALIDAVVEEGGEDAIDLLEELKATAADAQARRRFQGALMRIRTRSIDPAYRSPSPAGTAYLASCDGQGAFVLLGLFKKPNGTSTTVNLCIRAASDVRDGFVLPRHKQRDFRRMMKQLCEGTGCRFVPISLPEAAAVVAEAVDRTAALDLSLPADAHSAVRLFQQVGRARSGRATAARAADNVSLEEVRRLLGKDIYRNWLFDTGDLVSAGVIPPSRKKAGEAWLKAAARKLDRPLLKKRLTAMARHMERWHACKGEGEEAALCAAAALQTERDFANSPLVRAVLEKTLQSEPGRALGEVPIFGAPEVRQYLKSKFFQHLRRPLGKHLALLDFTEVALSCLDSAIGFLPGERHPRDETKPLMAHAVAGCFLDLVNDTERRSVDAHLQSMTRALSRVCSLRKKECLEIGAIITLELNLFVEEVCCDCPVACLRWPGRVMAEAFFSPHHPVEMYLEESGKNRGK
jgi:hypothetical protein